VDKLITAALSLVMSNDHEHTWLVISRNSRQGRGTRGPEQFIDPTVLRTEEPTVVFVSIGEGAACSYGAIGACLPPCSPRHASNPIKRGHGMFMSYAPPVHDAGRGRHTPYKKQSCRGMRLCTGHCTSHRLPSTRSEET
jgi:hypothetical protein